MNSDSDRLKAAIDYIEALKAWIRSDGDRTGTCTYMILGELCEGCRCPRGKRAAKGHAAEPNSGSAA